MAVATMAMARGLLMLSPRLMLLLRLSLAMATVDTVMVATDTAVATTAMARGRLRLSPATATAADTAAMVGTAATAMVATAEATATAGDTATGVSYHQIRRSELSQKQNYKN